MTNNRLKESPGLMVTYLSDFKSHYEGTSFKHESDQIEMNPPLVYYTASNVQDTLELFETALLSGNDLISIGDGVSSTGVYTIGVGGLTSVEDCFNQAFLSSRFTSSGGVILLKAGTYNFSSSVTLPAGISIIGELGGTIINTLADYPPFIVSESPNVTIKNSSGTKADGNKINKFLNLSFFDNKSASAPMLKTTNSCFIYCDRGSNVEVDRCCFFGKTNGSDVTNFAINYNSGTSSSYNSVLTVKNSSIFGLQRAIQFEVDSSKLNKLIVNNNKIWVSGKPTGVTTKEKSVISFAGCDAQICNNIVDFGIDTIQKIDCFACNSTSPVSLSTLVMTGNQVKANYTLSDNNLIVFASATPGLYYRSVVSNNTIGGANDSNSWFIVVGDGVTTVGDVNGSNALDYIYTYFTQRNNTSTAAAQHNQITILIKPGTYYVNNGYFTTSASNLNFSLIGLPENGNYPEIRLNQSVGVSGGNPTYLGSKIENIIFYSQTKFWLIKPCDLFAKTTLQMHSKIEVKNCQFYNAAISIEQGSSALDTDVESIILIENCYFKSDASLGNATTSTRPAISGALKQAKVYIKNCHTSKGYYYGSFVYFTSNATYNRNDVVVENCNIYSLAVPSVAVIDVTNCRNMALLNNIIKKQGDTGPIVYGRSNTNYNTSTCFTAISNTINGDSTLSSQYGINISGFNNINISENTIHDCGFPVVCNMTPNNASTYLYNYEVNVNSNNIKFGTQGYGAIIVANLGSAFSNTPVGNVTISKNNVDMTSKASTTSYLMSINYDSTLYAPIYCSLTNSAINISNNNVTSFTTAQASAAQFEAVIASVGGKESLIDSNTISFSNLIDTRTMYGIYSAPDFPAAAFVSNYLVSKIINNSLNFASPAPTTKEIIGILSKNFGDVTITGNNVVVTSANVITAFIKSYINNSGAPSSRPYGHITNNNLVNTSGVAYIDQYAITNVDTAYDTISVHVVAKNNYNQMVKELISPYMFQPYGEYDKLNRPSILVSNKTDATRGSFVDSDPSSLSRSLQSIDSIAPGFDLPKGIYYTNILNNSPQASTNAHQIIVPINLGNYAKIIRVVVPIYYWNTDGATATFTRSGSLILGNRVRFDDRIEYVTDAAGIQPYTSTVAAFAKRSPYSSSDWDIDVSYNPEIIISPQRNYKEVSPYGGSVDTYGIAGPQPNPFLVVNMTISGGGLSATGFKFAIPYCEVTYRY